jgi:hypothetical protein
MEQRRQADEARRRSAEVRQMRLFD